MYMYIFTSANSYMRKIKLDSSAAFCISQYAGRQKTNLAS